MLADLPLDQLRAFTHPRPAPAGLREFWDDTLAEARAAGGQVSVRRVDHPLRTVAVHDVTFPGFGGDPIKAWWLVPVTAPMSGPVVIEYLGYGGGRGLPHERMLWAAHGYRQLVVDTRGQGAVWNTGATPDPHGSGPAADGRLTQGIESAETLYCRRLLTDAVLAVDAATALPGADADSIAVYGHSQGGAMALAAAALHPRVRAVAARTPFLCGIARSIDVTDAAPYSQLTTYLAAHRDEAEHALEVVGHVDIAYLAPWITCPARISVGLADVTCPPSGIFAAINAMRTEPEVAVWPYNGHEAGGAHDEAETVTWLARHLT